MKEALRHPSDPDVSVIVPFFNAERYIERCIRALLAQDLAASRFEILMVDNNSTDRSAEIVARHPRIRLLREPKQGAYAARNRGAREACGKVLAFTDPDCVAEPTWLSTLVVPLQSSTVELTVGHVVSGSSSSSLRLLDSYEHHKLCYTFSTPRPSLYVGYAGNLAVRRDAFQRLGGFVEDRRGGDTLLVVRSAELLGCNAVCYAAGARVVHLEVTSLASFYKKFFVYGRSRRKQGSHAPRRPLNRAERARIFRQAVRSESHPLLASVQLLALLMLGTGSFRAGRLAARWSPRLT